MLHNQGSDDLNLKRVFPHFAQPLSLCHKMTVYGELLQDDNTALILYVLSRAFCKIPDFCLPDTKNNDAALRK